MTAALSEPAAATDDRDPSPSKDDAPRQSRLMRLVALATRPGVLGIFGQATLSAANFVTGVMLGRSCGDDCLGIYALAMTCVYIGVGVQTELTSSPYHVYCIRRRSEALARYTGSVLVHQAIILLALIAATAAVLAATGQLEQLASVLLVLVWAGPLLVTREFVRQMSFARLQFRLAAILDVVAATVQVGSIGLLSLTGRLSPSTALASGAAAGAVTFGLWLFRHRRDISITRAQVPVHWARNFRFGRWTVATYLVGSTLPFVMPWVLAVWHSQDAVGRLAACNALIGLSYMFTTGIANALTGQATRDFRTAGRDGLMRRLRQAAAIIAVVLVPFIAVVALLGDWAVEFVYDADFAGLGHVSLVIAIGVLASGLSMVAGNGLWAIERPQDGFVADVVTLLTAILLAVLLVPSHSVLGAAIATVGGQIVGMAVRWVALRTALDRLAERSGASLRKAGRS